MQKLHLYRWDVGGECTRKREISDYRLNIACHAELQFVGFDEVGFFYQLVPSTIFIFSDVKT